MKKNKLPISIIIVHYQVKKELFSCLSSIENSLSNLEYEILVVDNDERPVIQQELAKRFPSVRYIKNSKNLGFSAGNNIGAKASMGEYLFFLNPDTIVKDNTIECLYEFLIHHSEVGVAAPLLYLKNGELMANQGVRTLTPLRALFSTSLIHRFFPNNMIANSYWMKGWNKKINREVDVVPGTAFMCSKRVFESVGGFDEKFFLYFEEFDFCRKVSKLGYSLFMISKTKVIHLWGLSTGQRLDKDSIFKQSQEYYFKKYYGLITSKVISKLLTFDKYDFILIVCLLIGLFLRTYRITELFMFIGDFGWFYLSALDILTKGIIPLVSIPSSVIWLHQGPLATYMIALSLWIGRMNPASPALFFSVLDVVTIYFVYLLGKKIKNVQVGLSAAMLYATSPLVLINVRMPYHTAAIPLFVCSVFLVTLVVLKKQKHFFWLFFLTGLLLQLELSNAIISLIFICLYFLYHKEFRLRTRTIIESTLGIFLGIFPFILYDVTHRFTQTLGFPLWVINRVRLFMGLTTSGNATTHNLPKALQTIWDHIVQIIFPYSEILVSILAIFSILIVIKLVLKKKWEIVQNKPVILLLLWIIIPVTSFIIHAAPGDAYFPFLFPVITLFVAYILGEIFQRKLFLVIFLSFSIGLFNAGYTLSQDYFLSTSSGIHAMPPNGYEYGPAFFIQDLVAANIAADSGGEPASLQMGGDEKVVTTGSDQYRYLLTQKGVKVLKNARYTYTIYDAKTDIPASEPQIYHTPYYTVTKTVSQ